MHLGGNGVKNRQTLISSHKTSLYPKSRNNTHQSLLLSTKSNKIIKKPLKEGENKLKKESNKRISRSLNKHKRSHTTFNNTQSAHISSDNIENYKAILKEAMKLVSKNKDKEIPFDSFKEFLRVIDAYKEEIENIIHLESSIARQQAKTKFEQNIWLIFNNDFKGRIPIEPVINIFSMLFTLDSNTSMDVEKGINGMNVIYL